MKSNLSIHGTMEPFDIAPAISHFSRVKSSAAIPSAPPEKNIPPSALDASLHGGVSSCVRARAHVRVRRIQRLS